jgi:hypothetical protein
MNVLDRYVDEVGKRLPRRGRSDIEAELHSTLEDMLEDRAKKAGHASDEAMQLALLKEYGPPEAVAATYHATQYLIGPRLFPFFVLVLKIVLTVLTVVLLVSLGIDVATHAMAGRALAQAIASGLAGILGSALEAFGNIVLVFAILERALPTSEFKFRDGKQEWDPASLMREAEPAEVKLWEPISAIVAAVAALVLFNLYPQLIGINFLRNGAWTSVPALTGTFFRWLPAINVLWALQIALNLVLLRRGRWQPSTKWFSIALDVAGIGLGYLLLSGPPIVSLSAPALQGTGLDAAGAAVVSLAAEQGARLLIAMIMIVQGAHVVKDVVRHFLRRR